MSRRPRGNHTAAFKANGALAAVKGEKTLLELAQQFDARANQITPWKSQLLEGAAAVFGGEAKTGPAEAAAGLKSLHAKTGQLALENGFFRRGAREGRIAERKAMIGREHKPPVKRQAGALSISRGAAYYRPRPVSKRDLLLMRSLDELHLHHPFAGSRITLMAKMGIEAGDRFIAARTRRSRRRDTGPTRIR